VPRGLWLSFWLTFSMTCRMIGMSGFSACGAPFAHASPTVGGILEALNTSTAKSAPKRPRHNTAAQPHRNAKPGLSWLIAASQLIWARILGAGGRASLFGSWVGAGAWTGTNGSSLRSILPLGVWGKERTWTKKRGTMYGVMVDCVDR
jgi:hypothetical protein